MFYDRDHVISEFFRPSYYSGANWEQREKEELARRKESLKDVNILFAVYQPGCYCGDAFVLYEENNNLYEVNASHCSCHGLEGQWNPEETTPQEIRYRVKNGALGKWHDYGIDYKPIILEVLDQFEQKTKSYYPNS